MTVLTWIAAFLTGFLASLGVGGGMILIIWFTAVCGMGQLEAQGINLIFFIPIALLSVIMHRKNGLIDIKALLPAIAAGAVSAAAGVFAAHYIGSAGMKRIFAVFILIMGIQELMKSGKSDKKSNSP